MKLELGDDQGQELEGLRFEIELSRGPADLGVDDLVDQPEELGDHANRQLLTSNRHVYVTSVMTGFPPRSSGGSQGSFLTVRSQAAPNPA